MASYSPSKLSCFEQCPLRFKFSYVDGIRKDDESIDAFMGTCVHETLEKLLKLKKDFDREPTLEAAEAKFLEIWEKMYHPAIFINDEELTAEDYKNRGLLCLRNYFEMEEGQDFGELLELELSLRFQLGGISYNGKVDRIQRNGNTVHIIDYKTSRSPKSQESADADKQLALYELGIRQLFPEVEEVQLHWYMLGQKEIVTSIRTPESREALELETCALVQAIESATDFRPNETGLCDWCEYQEECEREKELRLVEAAEVTPPVEELVDEYAELVEKRAALKEDLKEIEDRRDELEFLLAETAKSEDAWSVQSDRYVLDIEVTPGLYMPGKNTDERGTLEQIIRDVDLLAECSDISKSRLMKLVEGGAFGEHQEDVIGLFDKRDKIDIKVNERAPDK